MKARGAIVPVACSLVLAAGCSSNTAPNAPGTSVESSGGSSSGIRGCVPECSNGLDAPGTLPVGDYTTTYFLDGHLTVSYEKPWESTEDQGVEFNSAPVGTSDVHRVLFWDDILPVDDHGQRVSGVPITADGLLQWFMSNPTFDVSAPHDGSIGSDIPATVIDLTVAPGTANQDPGCPVDVCVNYFTWPNVSGVYGTGGDSVLRLYLADVAYGGQTHLLVAAIEAQNSDDMRAFLPEAERVIGSARAPVTPA